MYLKCVNLPLFYTIIPIFSYNSLKSIDFVTKGHEFYTGYFVYLFTSHRATDYMVDFLQLG